jgi:hypothetical protein
MHYTISILLLTAIHHNLLSIGIYILLPYSLFYWLLTVSFSIYLIPIMVYGYKLYSYNIDNITNLFYSIHSCNTSILQSLSHYNLSDLCCIANLTRAIYYLFHWLYQLIYYGIRLFIVMVLHSFSVGCINHGLIFYYTSLLTLGCFIDIILLFYISIQLYVIIAFSITFLYSTLLDNSLLIIPLSLVDSMTTNLILYCCWITLLVIRCYDDKFLL